MAQTANIRAFRRTNIPSVEKSIGGGVLALLVGIGVLVFLKGRDYDPSTYTGDAAALESTRQAVEGKAATLRDQTDLRAYEQAGVAGTVAAPAAGFTINALIQGLVPMGPTETYNEETLYEKINGRAPAYLEYNFQELNSRSFTVPSIPSGFLDVYLYKMDSPLNAFGIFSAERSERGQALDFVMDGYRSEMGYFMRVGSTYAQILASSTDEAIMEMAGKFTEEISKVIGTDDSGLEGRALLPEANQIPGTLNYINDNAYGQAVLNGVFEATYEVDGTELKVFAQSTTPETAQANWETLRDFYGRYGSVEEPVTINGAQVLIADMFGQWNVIYLKDNAISGVVEATDRDSALNYVSSLLNGASEASEAPDEYAY